MKLNDIYTAQQIVGAVLGLDSNTDHHYLGGSSLYRRKHCHASAIAEAIDGTDTSSDHASKGTFIHGEIESALRVGDIGTANPHVLNAVAYADRMRDNLSGCAIYPEHRLEMYDTEGKLLSFGTADVLFIDDIRRGYIRDWKTGSGWETCYPAQIMQNRSYIAAAILKHGLISCDGKTVETETGTEGVEVCARDREWAEQFRLDLMALKRKVISPEAEFADKCGDFCQYCKVGEKGSRKCPVLQMEDKFAADVVGLTIPEPVSLSALENADRRLIAAKQVIKACEAIEEEEKNIIIANGGSPGHIVYKIKACEYTVKRDESTGVRARKERKVKE